MHSRCRLRACVDTAQWQAGKPAPRRAGKACPAPQSCRSLQHMNRSISQPTTSPPALPTQLPRVVTIADEMRRAVVAEQATGRRVGVVPTMGALHEGHLSLVRASQAECEATVVTIFVNPSQFGPKEDFTRYPRNLDGDLAALGKLGVSWVFAPGVEVMYPEGHSTFVEPPQVSQPLEGRCRPGHFRGVATVVLKLFQIVPADVAYFGQKDYQQSLVVRRMVADLNVPTEIRVCPIVRESDGLALSSRNVYLSPTERVQALALSRSLHEAESAVRSGERDAEAIRRRMRQVLEAACIERIDYVALADPESFAEPVRAEPPVVALVAAYVGTTRLIDNRIIAP